MEQSSDSLLLLFCSIQWDCYHAPPTTQQRPSSEGGINSSQHYFLSILENEPCYTLYLYEPSFDQGSTVYVKVSPLSSSSGHYQQIYSSVDCSETIRFEITNSL